MGYLNLRSFLEALKHEGELQVIDEQIDPYLELAEIQRRVVAAQGPALLFLRVARTEFPVVTNLFGTRRRIELAFGKEPYRLFKTIAEAVDELMSPSISLFWKHRHLIKTGLKVGTRSVSSGPVLECVIEPARLTFLPQIQSWPNDGGPFITLPLVYSEHPVSGKANLGMYRSQIYEDGVAGMHFQIHRGIGFHYFEAERRQSALPVNIFLGGPPALILSAIAPLPENIPEIILASFLQGSRLALIRNPDISRLPVIAEAEFALVGRVPANLRRTEGPFGDHYGYYSLAHPFPIFEVERILHRKNAIFPATVVGRPRQEDHYIGEYLQEMFAPIYPLVMNGVRAVWAYDDAGVHPLAAAVVSERYHREALMAALRILGEGQLSLTKFLLATDTSLPLQNFRQVLTHVLERADFASDLFVFSHVAQDTLDYTSGRLNEGSKAILLGLGEKRFDLQPGPAAELLNPVFREQRVFAPGVLVVEGPPWEERDSTVKQLLDEPAVRPFRIVCLVDNAKECVRDDASFLWTVFTRLEPAADIRANQLSLERFHVMLSAPLLLDCRIKPWYPPIVKPLPLTVSRVDALWSKIFGKKYY